MENVLLPIILSALGQSEHLGDAQLAITVGKSALDVLQKARAAAATPEGRAALEAAQRVLALAQKDADGHVHIGRAEPHEPADRHPREYAAGQYVWDPLRGWVWVPA